MDQALNSQKTPHTSPLRASYGMSFVSILMKNDRVIKGCYCNDSDNDDDDDVNDNKYKWLYHITMDIITMVIFQFCFYRGNYTVERVVIHHGFYSYAQETSHSAPSRASHNWYEYFRKKNIYILV